VTISRNVRPEIEPDSHSAKDACWRQQEPGAQRSTERQLWLIIQAQGLLPYIELGELTPMFGRRMLGEHWVEILCNELV